MGTEELDPFRKQAIDKVLAERLRQIETYGFNSSTPLGFGGSVAPPWLAPYSRHNADEVCRMFRADYLKYEQEHGSTTWMHLIREEVAELFETNDAETCIAEAVQVAALCVSLIEHLSKHGDPDVNLSPKNLKMLLDAYDDGDGSTVSLVKRDDGYIEGWYDTFLVYEGTEIDGVLYSICYSSPTWVTVAVGDELAAADGAFLDSPAEARAYIKGLTAK